jgi:ActR/RegA family two-component response regulator
MTSLTGKTVLVVEDDYFIATEMCRTLEQAGARVLGPIERVADSLALIARSDRIDGAVLDLNLREEMAFPVADMLGERGVPFVFATGYDDSVIPERYRDAPRCRKPVEPETVCRALFD